MSEHEYQERWPRCRNFDVCGGRIYLPTDPVTGEKREVCAACERAGEAPATQLPTVPEPYGAKG